MRKRKRCTRCHKAKDPGQFYKGDVQCKDCVQLRQKINSAIKWLDDERRKPKSGRTPSIDCEFECPVCGSGYADPQEAEECCEHLPADKKYRKAKYESA